MNHLSSKSVILKKRGVVLLIAILISSVALAVGVGVYTRTYKELLLSSFWKQSQVAFGAADAGLECALYWDTRSTIPPGQAACFGSPVPWVLGGSWSFTQNVYSTDPRHGCAIVTITKDPLGPLANPPRPSTIIESRGQSDDCLSTNPRRVERAVRLEY